MAHGKCQTTAIRLLGVLADYSTLRVKMSL